MLIFMGTPHRGGNCVALASLFASTTTALFRRPKNDLLESLRGNSLLREERSDYFRHHLEDYYIISFFETLNSKVGGKNIGLVSLVAA